MRGCNETFYLNAFKQYFKTVLEKCNFKYLLKNKK